MGKNISFTSYSQEDLKVMIAKAIESNNSHLYDEMTKLRERVADMEEMFRIYGGRIKLDNGKTKA